MEKLKRAFVSLFLAALFAFAAIFGIAGAKQHSSVSAADEEEKPKIGVSIPVDNWFYSEVLNFLIDEWGEEYDFFIEYNQWDEKTQVNQILSFIADGYAGIVLFSTNGDKVFNALKQADDAEIKIIVVGRPNDNYPAGTIFVTYDYYGLGASHVEWLLREASLAEVKNICLFYPPDEDGVDYRNGFYDTLSETNFSGIFREISYFDSHEIEEWVKYWINSSSDGKTRNEMVTLDETWGSIILDAFHAADYIDTRPGVGTGIRALPDPSALDTWNAAEALAQGVSEAITEAWSNPMLRTNNVCYVPFAPAISQYVVR